MGVNVQVDESIKGQVDGGKMGCSGCEKREKQKLSVNMKWTQRHSIKKL